VEAGFWHERWAANKIGFHLDEVNPYLVRYWPELNLPLGSRVFVPLAGKTLDIIWLMQQGFEVIANEISDIAVQAFFKEQGLNYEVSDWAHGKAYQSDKLRFLSGDMFELSRADLGQVDAIYDRASFIALPESMRPGYIKQLFALTGIVPQMLVTLEYDQSQMAGPPFGVMQSEVQYSYSSKYQQPPEIPLEPAIRVDVLDDHAHFAARGLTSMFECVYLLQVPKK